ncbi:hypothetical protein OEA41_009313 [Lepraria neglecta]|uniref:Uncharacterized protein n=1 Tax=Lepraria neglecta TaxID=209136 RepID=A0AAE0DHN2_9LECA|nr:hypothetical protein OEA41_009313 [Lepraria neglecta]
MPASRLRESAPNAPNAPLEQPPKAYWPAEEHHQRLLLVISIFLFLFFLFNFSAYLNERKRKRMAELEYREEAEDAQKIEKSKAKVVAWMEVTETVSKPASPIDINRPKYQSLVLTSTQPEYGNGRAQRPKPYRSKTEPLLHRSSRDSEVEFLYRTFDDPSRGSKPIKKSNGPANSEPSSWSTVVSENTYKIPQY